MALRYVTARKILRAINNTKLPFADSDDASILQTTKTILNHTEILTDRLLLQGLSLLLKFRFQVGRG